MPNVLHLIETAGPGGAENMLYQLAVRQKERDFQPSVVLPRDGWLTKRLVQAGIAVKVAPVQGRRYLRWFRDISRLISAESIDVLHTHEFLMNVLGSVVSKLNRIPQIATVHGKNYYADRAHRRKMYRWMSKSSQLVAVSDDIAEYLVSGVGVNEMNVTVIHNGVDTRMFAPHAGRKTTVRDRLGIAKTDFVIGSVGNLYPVKGHVHLIRALPAVCLGIREHCTLLIAGRGALQDELEREADRLGVASSVKFVGVVEDVASFLAGIDVFVMPSLSEGLPLALIEAMASAKPIIATNVGGIPEIIDHCRNGLLVESGRPDAISAALIRLHASAELAGELASRARADAMSHFDIGEMVARYAELYGIR